MNTISKAEVSRSLDPAEFDRASLRLFAALRGKASSPCSSPGSVGRPSSSVRQAMGRSLLLGASQLTVPI